MEPDEGLEKLADALKICHLYRDMYFTKRSGLQPYFKEKAVIEWDFQPSLIFSRLDRFISQLNMMEVEFLASLGGVVHAQLTFTPLIPGILQNSYHLPALGKDPVWRCQRSILQ